MPRNLTNDVSPVSRPPTPASETPVNPSHPAMCDALDIPRLRNSTRPIAVSMSRKPTAAVNQEYRLTLRRQPAARAVHRHREQRHYPKQELDADGYC